MENKTAKADPNGRGGLATALQPASPSMSPDKSRFEVAENQRRIRDVESARSIYNRFVQDNVLRSRNMAETRNQLEGGRPFDPRILEEQGAAWQTNVNFGDAQTMRDRTLAPFWKMVNEVPHKINVQIDSGSPNSDMYEMAFAEAFDAFIDDWGADYFTQFNAFVKNFVDFGPGIAQWMDKDSPRWESVNVQRIYFPKNARMSPDKWDVVAMVRDISPSELYLKIKNNADRKLSEYAGWNIDALEMAIVSAMGGNGKRDPRDYTRYQDDLVQNDITIQSIFEPLQLIWMYVRQFDGKIGCYVFTRNGEESEFLFEDDAYAEDWRQLLGAVWYDTGTDTLVHSIKGFAIKNFYFASLLNRTKSRMMDSATMAFGMNFQRTESMVADEVPPVENYGPFTVFPENLTQVQFYPQLQQGMAVISQLQQNQSENNALYRQQEKEIAQSDTATQANILANIASSTAAAQAAMFLAQMGENVFAETFRRLRRKGNTDEDAKMFVDRLRDKGVPDEVIFKTPCRVRTGANAGSADPALRSQRYQMLIGMSKLPGVNGRWALTNFIAEAFGSQAVRKALLPEGAQSEPLQRREAMMENADLGNGMNLPVDQSDAHFEHLQEHLKPLGAITQKAQQNNGQVAPEELTALIIGIEHCGEHMQFLSNDETQKQQFLAIKAPFSQIQSIARGLIARQQKLQQQGPQAAGMPAREGKQQQQASSHPGHINPNAAPNQPSVLAQTAAAIQ
jgi:hypothetical protein